MKKQIRAGVFALVALLCVSLSLPGTASAAFPGVNGRIAYTDSDGSYDIFTAKPDGTAATNLTNATTTQDDPAYSPDGTKIVYAVLNGGGSQYDIKIMNSDGSNQTTILSNGFFNHYPNFSPDGTKIVFASNLDASNYEIYTMNIDGTGITRLTTMIDAAVEPEYSPDGTKIVFRDDTMSDTDIYVMNADGTGVTDITQNSNREENPSWSPDGSKITFMRHDGTDTEIAAIEPDGTNLQLLTVNSTFDNEPFFSPDGQYIAYRDAANEKIRIMNADGTNNHEAIDGTFLRGLSWQPLTAAPTAASSTQTLTLSGGTGTIDIPALYTDAYGEGVNNSSVTITSQPTQGTVSVNSSTGVITYTQDMVAAGSFWSNLASVFFPKASAQAADSFGYSVCSNASASLCATGTVSVLGLSTLAETGNNQSPIVVVVAVWLIGSACAVFAVKKRSLKV